MESVSTRLSNETYRLIAETADERGVSKAEVLRELVEKGLEYDDRVEELETENERLHRERRHLLEQREEHTELVRTVERQQSLQERRAQAGLLTKTKWALFGMSADED